MAVYFVGRVMEYPAVKNPDLLEVSFLRLRFGRLFLRRLFRSACNDIVLRLWSTRSRAATFTYDVERKARSVHSILYHDPGLAERTPKPIRRIPVIRYHVRFYYGLMAKLGLKLCSAEATEG